MAPTCLEYVDDAFVGIWDFTAASYQTTSVDQGPNGLDFNLLDDQTSYDPIYVDNQGLYFDGNSHIRTTNTYTQDMNSFTYEGWIRPTDTALTGTIFSFEETPNVDEFAVSFDGAGNLEVDFGPTLTFPITYADVGDWHYVGVSVHKIWNANRSRVCVKFGTEAEQCQTTNNVVALTGPSTVQVGKNFKGMIKDFHLLDWPKKAYEFDSPVQTVGCTAFNGYACPMCPASTGECISVCDKDQYGATCQACDTTRCTSCWGATYEA